MSMKYTQENIWESIPGSDWHYRFFVECFEEKLSKHTPHFYQSRLMNVFSACDEILVYIKEYLSEQRNKAYILNALNEFDSCLAGDHVARELCKGTKDLRDTVFRKIRGDNLESEQLARLSIICRQIISLANQYEVELLKQLRSGIFQSPYKDSEKGRATQSIYDLTGLYITHLTGTGHLASYLFNRLKYLKMLNNFKNGRNVEQQFEYVTDGLKSGEPLHYDVYYAMDTKTSLYFDENNPNRIGDILTNLPDELSKNNSKEWDKLKQGFASDAEIRYFKKSLKSNNHTNAAWRTKEELDQFFDAATALNANSKVKISPHCITVKAKGSHVLAFNVEETIGKDLTFESGLDQSNPNLLHGTVFPKLNKQGKEHLARSLRYLRFARDTASLELKFINLWIALESLFTDGVGNIIANVTGYVPHVYAVMGLERRVSYLTNLFIDNPLPTQLAIESNNQMFALLKNQDEVVKILKSETKMEHLKFRLSSTFLEFSVEKKDGEKKDGKENKPILDRIKRSREDVERQLRRIYFLRNKIVHTGHHSNIQPQLVTHLFSYLFVCYLAIQKSAQQVKQDENSLADLLIAYKMGVEIVEERAAGTNEITNYDEIIPVPVI